MINFLHAFHPLPILFSLGPVNIYWYGICIVIGIIAAILVALKLARFYNIEKDTIIDLAFWLILAGILGARIYHILLELPYYAEHPLDIFKIWQGGLAIHGGIIAGIIVIWILAKKTLQPPFTMGAKEKTPLVKGGEGGFWLLASIIAPGLALAQAVGRWGNYFNQENFGGPTSSSWGIPINPLNRPAEYISSQYFHPTFLYESIGSLIIFIILILFHRWIMKNKKQNCVMYYVLCVMCYLIMYSILRFFMEFIRIDPTPEFFGLRWPQIASLIIIVASLILLLKNKKIYANI
jgi:phosphatidylglycerol:prolipoprotein diacylglycerol transferase